MFLSKICCAKFSIVSDSSERDTANAYQGQRNKNRLIEFKIKHVRVTKHQLCIVFMSWRQPVFPLSTAVSRRCWLCGLAVPDEWRDYSDVNQYEPHL